MKELMDAVHERHVPESEQCQRLMHAKHYFTEVDYLGMSLKFKIAASVGCLILPKVISKACP